MNSTSRPRRERLNDWRCQKTGEAREWIERRRRTEEPSARPDQTGTAELQLVRVKSAEDRVERLPQRVAIGILEPPVPLDD
jgi:hypothetical protein